MEYQVPQFIEVEDKIIGPLTLRQFIYLAGGIGLAVATFFYLPFFVWIFIGVPVLALAFALAFYQVNGKPFIEVLEAGFSYYTGSKLFLWHKEEPKAPPKAAPPPEAIPITAPHGPRLTSGKLHDLAWSLDVKSQEQK